MINRVILRIKVLQTVYAYYKSDNSAIATAEKNLIHSIRKNYELYIHLFQLAIEVTHYAELKIDARKNKLAPTAEDLAPNERFVQNRFVAQLRENRMLKEFLLENKTSWDDEQDTVKLVYDLLVATDFYKEYMETQKNDYTADKAVWRNIYKKIILTSEDFSDSIEDQSIYWADDLEIMISFIIKTIKKFDFKNGAGQELLPMFNDDDDQQFAIKLLTNVLENKEDYLQLIDEHTKNWDLDRIAFMDIVIMQLAIAEIMTFPTIPVSVTLNEYIEMAKHYSTEKSATFINGVLDKIVKELKLRKKLIKVVNI